jgi:Asp-tRNA(Asn)/Glu-tRNA(Gln) amidotransferase A subunit family amidase
VGRLRLKGTNPKIDAAIDHALARAGFQVIPMDERFVAAWEQAKRDGNAVAASGAWISGKKYQSSPGVALRTKVVILNGQLNYVTKYKGALARREQWQSALKEAFKKVDVIALPTLQGTPFLILPNVDVGLVEAQMLQFQNTVPVNYAGNPAIALPVPLHGAGFGITSLQLIGPNGSEAELLNAGRFVEGAVCPSHRGKSYDRLATGCASSSASSVLRER